MDTYRASLLDILTAEDNFINKSRTQSDRLSRVGGEFRYDVSNNRVPMTTGKYVNLDNIIHELIWFLRGDTNIKYLVDNDVNIWTPNAFDHYLNNQGLDVEEGTEEWRERFEAFEERIRTEKGFAETHGELGPVYGKQWRDYEGVGGSVDQVQNVVDALSNRSYSTRKIVNAWDPTVVSDMALPPCHHEWQVFYEGEQQRGGNVSLLLNQRSADAFLGEPYNVTSYGLLANILSHVSSDENELGARQFVHRFGDHHIYCGVGERGRWYRDKENRRWLREAALQAEGSGNRENYAQVREDLENKLPEEPEGFELSDHIPQTLTYLSRPTHEAPTVSFRGEFDLDSIARSNIVLPYENKESYIKGRMAV